MDKKIAINLHDNKEYRFVIESDGSYFVLAPKRKTRGWRYSPTQFFNYYKIKETKTGLTENDKWKSVLKRLLLYASKMTFGTIFKRYGKTYITTFRQKKNAVFTKNIGLAIDTTKKKANKIIWIL